jgi:hypothetical protein
MVSLPRMGIGRIGLRSCAQHNLSPVSWQARFRKETMPNVASRPATGRRLEIICSLSPGKDEAV